MSNTSEAALPNMISPELQRKNDSRELLTTSPTTEEGIDSPSLPEDVSNVLVASDVAFGVILADETNALRDLDESLPRAPAAIDNLKSQSTVAQQTTAGVTRQAMSNSFNQSLINVHTDTATTPHDTTRRVSMEALQLRAPLSNDEEPWIISLRIGLIAFSLDNPESSAECFEKMSMQKPAEFHGENPWLAMFKIIGLGKKRRFTCYACRNIYSRPERAIVHWRQHINHRPYKCSGACGKLDCTDRFFGSEPLRAHVYRKKLPKTKCPACGNMYDSRNLPRHQRRCPQGQANVGASEGSTSGGRRRQSRSAGGIARTVRRRATT